MSLTIITDNNKSYPLGWEWLDKVPTEDFTWLINVWVRMVDNTDIYDFVKYKKESITPKIGYMVNEVDTEGLAKFLEEDQGYLGGIREYGYYIAAKALNIDSEKEFLKNYNQIRFICNEKPYE